MPAKDRAQPGQGIDHLIIGLARVAEPGIVAALVSWKERSAGHVGDPCFGQGVFGHKGGRIEAFGEGNLGEEPTFGPGHSHLGGEIFGHRRDHEVALGAVDPAHR